MKLLNGTAAINKAIASISNRGKRFDRDVQQAALSVINHAEQHGDVTLATSLVNALPKGSRSNALKAYLETFGKMTWDKDAFRHQSGKKTDMDGAKAIMWTEFKPEPAYKPTDLPLSLTRLLAKVERDTEMGHKHDKEQVEAIRKLVEQFAPAEEA